MKSFKQFIEEIGSTTAGVASIQNPPGPKFRKKKVLEMSAIGMSGGGLESTVSMIGQTVPVTPYTIKNGKRKNIEVKEDLKPEQEKRVKEAEATNKPVVPGSLKSKQNPLSAGIRKFN